MIKTESALESGILLTSCSNLHCPGTSLPSFGQQVCGIFFLMQLMYIQFNPIKEVLTGNKNYYTILTCEDGSPGPLQHSAMWSFQHRQLDLHQIIHYLIQHILVSLIQTYMNNIVVAMLPSPCPHPRIMCRTINS